MISFPSYAMLWSFTFVYLHTHMPVAAARGGPNPTSAIRHAHRAMRACLPLTPGRPPPLSLLADRCSSIRQLKQVHAQMIVSARIADNYAASRLLSCAALSPSGDLPHALRLFRATPSPNSFMWNTLVRALAASPTPASALALFGEMLRSGPPPGKHTFPFLLKACAALPSSPAVSIAPQVHAHVLRRGLGEDPYVVNGLVRCYGAHGHPGDARKVFDESPERTLIVWTSMISAYAQNFCSNEALLLFDQMIQAGVEPSDATLSSVLSACARSGGLDLGQQIHSLIMEKEIEVGVILGTALVDMYAKNGAIAAALELFEEMPEKNTATWNAVICGLAHHGHANAALELFHRLEREHVQPNDVTFVGVLSACSHAGLLEVGRRIFDSMERVYNIEPKLEHHGCMVDLLGRCGELLEAERLIRGMKWEADVIVWGALLTACRNRGNIEIAERVVHEMLRLDPGNHGVYVVLSNMYAEVGRWKDVVKLRKVMKIEGLQKIPAWSSVEGGTS